MTFESVVNQIVALFDVTQSKAVDTVNDRLQDMVTRSTALRATVSLGTTVNGTATYTLAANVAKILKIKVVYADGTAVYEGDVTVEDLWDIDANVSRPSSADSAFWFVVEPDSDTDATTDLLRLYPTPQESGKAITGLVALRPAALTYATVTALPIPTDVHDALLEGSKAKLYAEEGRSDEAAVPSAQFEQGIIDLRSGVTKRGKGTGGHRMALRGYDLAR